MPIYGKNKGGGENFAPAPSGVHPAVCVDVIDLGMQESEYEGKKSIRHAVQLRWLLGCEERRTDGLPFIIRHTYTLSTHPKAALRDHVECWRGKMEDGMAIPDPFTDEEVEEYDYEQLIGWPCKLRIEHYEDRDGNTRAGIAKGSKPVPAPEVKLDMSEYTRQVWNPVERKYADYVPF